MHDLRREMRIVSSIVRPETNTTDGNQRFNRRHTGNLLSPVKSRDLLNLASVLARLPLHLLIQVGYYFEYLTKAVASFSSYLLSLYEGPLYPAASLAH